MVMDGDVNVYLQSEDQGPLEMESVEEVLVGRKRVIITSKDFG